MEGDRYRLTRPVTAADWSRGPENAPITIIEYLDFQCPCCQGSFPVVEELLAQFGDKVRYVAREFPITSSHPRAEAAARAAEAAGLQGHFWGMYHELFVARGRLDPANLELYARRLSLDLDRFRADLASDAVAAKIQQDKRGGLRTGVNGTPTFFINDLRYEGVGCPVREEELGVALQEAEGAAPGGRVGDCRWGIIRV